jgi:hypothetical protein
LWEDIRVHGMQMGERAIEADEWRHSQICYKVIFLFMVYFLGFSKSWLFVWLQLSRGANSNEGALWDGTIAHYST